MRSQDTTDLRPVSFPFWMVQEIALDLVEKERLEASERIHLLQLVSYSSLVQELKTTDHLQSLQLELLRKENSLLTSRLVLQKTRKPQSGTGTWLLRMAAAVGLGWMLGAVM